MRVMAMKEALDLMIPAGGGFQIWEPGNLVPVQVEVVRAPMNIFSYMDHPNDK